MPLTIPTPETLLAQIWFLLGIQFGRSFGKKLDQEIQKGEWFKKQGPWAQGIIKRCLDFLHHWWIGMMLVLYLPNITEAVWFGWGLVVDDLPDIPRRYGINLSSLIKH